jgi:hypothetical protein
MALTSLASVQARLFPPMLRRYASKIGQESEHPSDVKAELSKGAEASRRQPKDSVCTVTGNCLFSVPIRKSLPRIKDMLKKYEMKT